MRHDIVLPFASRQLSYRRDARVSVPLCLVLSIGGPDPVTGTISGKAAVYNRARYMEEMRAGITLKSQR
jgi:hypothetical protein